MQFTRMFLLKSMISRVKPSQIHVNNQDPVLVIKEIIVSHPHIDLVITLILSLLVLCTRYNDDVNFFYSNSLNIYFVTLVTAILLIQYLFFDYLDELKNIQNGRTFIINSNRNSSENINPNLTDNNSNNQINTHENNRNFFRLLYFKKIYSIFDNLAFGNFKLPIIFFNNWHTFKSLIQIIKILITLSSFGLSLIFCLFYSDQKMRMDREKYFYIHLLIVDFFEFYSGFRVCYFLIKIVINMLLLPVYLSCFILGVIEDSFNERLNKLINTKVYSGRSSIKPPPNGRTSELEEYCSICLNTFQLEELVSTLPCSRRHTFHTNCLQQWFVNSVKCPLCRSDFHNSIELLVNSRRENVEMQPIELNERLLG
jgi:hypothetical protein